MRTTRTWQIILLLAILALALGLRLYRLDAQSLWNDEGTSLALAQRDLGTITRNAANDIHPPLYYYLLHFWIQPFGASALAARGLSVFLGTLVIAVTYALSRKVLSANGALLAALIAALSPFQVYYSQEARMYILVTLTALLALWACYNLLSVWANRGSRLVSWNAGGLLLASIATLYSHYYGATLLLALNAAFVVWWLTRQKRTNRPAWGAVGRWAILQLITVAAFLPWLALSWNTLVNWPAISSPLSLGELALNLMTVMPLGVTVQMELGTRLLGVILFGLALLGIVHLSRRRNNMLNREALWSTTLLAGALLVPPALMYLASLQRPMYNPKFILLATPALHILQAAGITAILPHRALAHSPARRIIGSGAAILLTGVLVAASGYSLNQLYTNPRYARDDYRGAVAHIQAAASPDAAILINAPSQIETIDYYYDGNLPMIPVAIQRPPDRATLESELEAIAQRHDQLFGIFWATDESDPEGIVEGWLAQNAFKTMDRWYGNIRLVVYAVAPAQEQEMTHETNAVLGDRIRLTGYSLITPEPRSGEIVQLALYWKALEPMAERYTVFVQLLDARQHIVGQHDAEPAGGRRPTHTWEPGEMVVDNHGILIRPGTMAGAHSLLVGLYNSADGQRLPVTGGTLPTSHDAIILTEIEIARPLRLPTLNELEIETLHQASWGGLTFQGHSLYPIGQAHAPDAPILPGDALEMVLFWQKTGPEAPPKKWTLSLTDRSGAALWQAPLQPGHGQHAWEAWREGEIVRDVRHIILPGELAPGRYSLELTLEPVDSSDRARPYVLERIRVVAY